MIISFYVSSSDPKKAVKTKALKHTASNAAIYRDCSVMEPEFLVNFSSEIMQSNYCVANISSGGDTTESCYFIRDKILLPGGRIVVVCYKDVLSTFWNNLKNCKANLIRQEKESNKNIFMFDDKMVGKTSTHVETIPFSEHPFSLPTPSKPCVLLTVLGGSSNPQNIESTTKGVDCK